MDLIGYLWGRVELREGAGMLAAAMNTTPIRDALLREAARRGGWSALAGAAGAAAREARAAGWSPTGPETVEAVCHWVLADQMLRGVPRYGAGAELADAVLAFWDRPAEAAAALAAAPPLHPDDAADFTEMIENRDSAAQRELADQLDDAAQADPELFALALNTPPIRDGLLRQAARTGEWDDLRASARDAAEAAAAAGASTAGPDCVAALACWMLGDRGQARALLAAHPDHDLAAALGASWDEKPSAVAGQMAESAPPDEQDARSFLADADPVILLEDGAREQNLGPVR